jgi:hypothetical protein
MDEKINKERGLFNRKERKEKIYCFYNGYLKLPSILISQPTIIITGIAKIIRPADEYPAR